MNIDETIQSIADRFNPSLVDWQNAADVTGFIFSIVLVVLALFGLYFFVKNIKNIISFFTKSFTELKKVDWLSRKDTFRLSLISVVLIIAGTLFILFADQAFLFIRNLILFGGN